MGRSDTRTTAAVTMTGKGSQRWHRGDGSVGDAGTGLQRGGRGELLDFAGTRPKTSRTCPKMSWPATRARHHCPPNDHDEVSEVVPGPVFPAHPARGVAFGHLGTSLGQHASAWSVSLCWRAAIKVRRRLHDVGARSAPTSVPTSADGRRCQAAPDNGGASERFGELGTTEALLDSDERPRYQRVANVHVARQAGSVLRVAPPGMDGERRENELDIAAVAGTRLGRAAPVAWPSVEAAGGAAISPRGVSI